MRDIWLNIAVHNEPAADRLLQKLFDKFDLVAAHPEIGPPRPEISPAARLIIEGRYQLRRGNHRRHSWDARAIDLA